jgi:ATP-dependent DNA helicase PIF1
LTSGNEIKNIWVELGLVNGTTGTVEDVVWKEHADVKKDQPQALLIAVDGYSGPALFTQQDGRKVIPVFSILREWEGARGSCSRRQFPVTLAFALTVHKSQGLTLNRVVLDIKDKDNTAGLTYVAVSRVRALCLNVDLIRNDFSHLQARPRRHAGRFCPEAAANDFS